MALLGKNIKNIVVVNFKKISSHALRVRFAPSPTGFIHLGGLRTAFFNYLFARKHNGKFILRIEDTDRDRIIPGSLEHIIATLKWANLTPDEGPTIGGNYGPYVQSERTELYKEMLGKLTAKNSVYRCFCTPKRLELLKREAAKNRETIKYDNRCRSLTSEEIKENIKSGKPYTVRLRLKDGPLTIKDMVYGDVTYDLSKIEGDPILVKSDGLPTYHLANVVDDHFMQISHVLRGFEWLVSTPKHLMLYEAFGWPAPRFAHLPLIVNKDGTKLSKRHDHIQIDSFRNVGYYPQTVHNYLTQMGGGFGALPLSDCQQIFSLGELAHNFCIEKVNSSPSKIDLDKFKYLNRICIKQMCGENLDQLIVDLKELLQKRDLEIEKSRFDDKGYVRKVIEWSLDRVFTFDDLSKEEFAYLWSKPMTSWKIQAFGTLDSVARILTSLIETLNVMTEEQFLNPESLLMVIKHNHLKFADIKFGPYMKLLRLSLTNLKVGAPIAETMHLLGRNITVQHLQNALDYVNILRDNDQILQN